MARKGVLSLVFLLGSCWCAIGEDNSTSPLCDPKVFGGASFSKFVGDQRCDVDENLLKMFTNNDSFKSMVNKTAANVMCIGFIEVFNMASEDSCSFDSLANIPSENFCKDGRMFDVLILANDSDVFDGHSNIIEVANFILKYCGYMCNDTSGSNELCWAFGEYVNIVMKHHVNTPPTPTSQPPTTESVATTSTPTPNLQLTALFDKKPDTPQESEGEDGHKDVEVENNGSNDDGHEGENNDTNGGKVDDENKDDSDQENRSNEEMGRLEDPTPSFVTPSLPSNDTGSDGDQDSSQSTSSETYKQTTTTDKLNNQFHVTTGPSVHSDTDGQGGESDITPPRRLDDETNTDGGTSQDGQDADKERQDQGISQGDQDDDKESQDQGDQDADKESQDADKDDASKDGGKPDVDYDYDDDDDGYSYWHFAAVLLFILFLGVGIYLASLNRKKIRESVSTYMNKRKRRKEYKPVNTMEAGLS
ncbi:clumping factor B-like [Dysidea avara]|uniref:clumping factor B-like n=1 Tax=Dysidea avara TaxID=196820 RepID=UPI00332BC7E2